MDAFNFLSTFSKDKQYSDSLLVISEYVTDIVNLLALFKKRAEDNADILLQVTKKIVEFNQPNPKKRYIEKVKALKTLKELKDMQKKE
jgi:hypothetical protein